MEEGKSIAQRFIKQLEEEELVFSVEEDEDGDTVVRLPYVHERRGGDDLKYQVTVLLRSSGLNARISAWPWRGLPLASVQEAMVLCNKANEDGPWVKWLVDEDNDITLRISTLISEDRVEGLKALVGLLTDAVSDNDEVVRGLLERKEDALPRMDQ